MVVGDLVGVAIADSSVVLSYLWFALMCWCCLIWCGFEGVVLIVLF